MFDIQKNGYSTQQVDDYVGELTKKYELSLANQNQTLQSLKFENEKLSKKLDEYIQKDGGISNALVVAVETAKEIENSAKTVYELEIQRIKILYKKWQVVLKQIIALYPNINNNSSVCKLFHDFEDSVVKILEKENEVETLAEERGHIDDKTYAKSLLQRIKEQSSYNARPSPVTQQPVRIKRVDTEQKAFDRLIEKEQSRIKKNAPPKVPAFKQNSNNFSSTSEFEKFMNSEFDDFNAFQLGKEPTKKTSNLFESTLVANKPNDSGFDLKEALTPKEDLEDIMKIFDLDEAN